jgi:DNA-binding XRE family transcriptional regulator
MFETARISTGLGREGAAFELHVGSRTLFEYEKGKSTPPADVVLNMSRIYRQPEMTQRYCKEYCPIGQAYSYEVLNNVCQNPVSILVKLREEVNEVTDLLDMLFSVMINKTRREDFKPEEWTQVETFILELMDNEHCIEMFKITLSKWADVSQLVKKHNKKCWDNGYIKKEKAVCTA